MAKFVIGSGLFTLLVTMFLFQRWRLTYGVNALLCGSVLGLIVGATFRFVVAPLRAHYMERRSEQTEWMIAVGWTLLWMAALYLTGHWIAGKPGLVWQWRIP